MKKLINTPSSVIADALRGIDAADENVRVDHENRIILRSQPGADGKVALVSGGGSGHEPLHGGFVGYGMLDAACVGEVFTSPTPDQIYAATVAAHRGSGVLHIAKNYTGDVLNFEMGAELAAAEGIEVRTVIVADDVAVQDSLYTAGRRGVGASVILEKIVGAAAEQGLSLTEVAAVAARVADESRSMGVALTSCTVPAAGKPTFDLPADEMEIGIGIHGEPGRHREKFTNASDIARQLVKPILADKDFSGQEVIVLLNGMGGTALIELYIMYAEVKALLDAAGVRVARNLVGNYVTSLEMAGCSVSLTAVDDELLALFDAPVKTAGLRWGA